jgi:hypothetical protein
MLKLWIRHYIYRWCGSISCVCVCVVFSARRYVDCMQSTYLRALNFNPLFTLDIMERIQVPYRSCTKDIDRFYPQQRTTQDSTDLHDRWETSEAAITLNTIIHLKETYCLTVSKWQWWMLLWRSCDVERIWNWSECIKPIHNWKGSRYNEKVISNVLNASSLSIS